MENNKGFSMVSVIMIVAFIIVIGIAGYFLISQYVTDYNNNLHNQNYTPPQTTQTPPDPTAGWNVVNNTDLGFQFKYPTDFGSKYASFQSVPTAMVISASSNTKIDASGCYIVDPQLPNKDSKVTINDLPFCVSTASDPGAGQLYNTSNYTTLRNGNYITLQYVVHTLNGCSPYMGTPDYQPCTDFMNSYNDKVTKVIETSVGTLQLTK